MKIKIKTIAPGKLTKNIVKNKLKKMAMKNPPENASKKLETKLETALVFKEEGNTLYKGPNQVNLFSIFT